MAIIRPALFVGVDALPFAAGAGAATFLGASNTMTASRAGVIAAAVAGVLFVLLGLASWIKYQGSGKRFWLLRVAVRTVATTTP